MPGRRAFAVLALALVGGCGTSTSQTPTDETSIRQELLRGVHAIRTTHDRHALRRELAAILVRLRRSQGSTLAARHARRWAIQGFEATIKGIRSQLDFVEHDSGEVAAATRDAERADRYLKLGANLLRAAGGALGIRIGTLNAY
jgi:hypothetical protein